MNRKDINEKISKALLGRGNSKVIKICQYCKTEFEVEWRKRNQKTCSYSCGAKYRFLNSEYKEAIRESSRTVMLRRHKEGDPTITWKSRTNRKPSYPEEITISLLNQLNLQYEREYPFHKYNIDFAFTLEKIALEIDGRQHADRLDTDKAKDALLLAEGWTVIRIPWVNDNNHNTRIIFELKKYLPL